MNTSNRIWLITGVSGGLGRALAKEAALQGEIVYGTLRKPEQINEFNELVPGKTFGIQLDVNNHDQIKSVVEQIITQSGRIDVLVNNAGYGLFGAIEELSMEEARMQMETNFFAVLAMTQAVLPIKNPVIYSRFLRCRVYVQIQEQVYTMRVNLRLKG